MSRGPVASLALVAVSALVLSVLPAHAVRFRRPYNNSVGVNYGFDHNGGGGCTDFACGGVCYDGHTGTDFPLPLGTPVLAPANGQVTAVYNGCANYGGLGNTCGGRCGNYVQIAYPDGTSTIYCHLQLNSISVGVGASVSCGQEVGHSASSGNSSGPHLHFGFRSGGASRDPFAGGCSQSTSYWVNQGSYPHNMPSAECEVTCECSPGQSQNGACGNCGTRDRTCGSDCRWGGWSSCHGEGECGGGQTETRACCDCGSQSRTCSGQCSWGGWSECAGPDPNGGLDACDTTEPGICAEGRIRCQQGCQSCVRSREPEPELCDDLDNDCNAIADDGFPSQMGEPPPKLAARLVDQSAPQSMAQGESATAWAVFANEGTSVWESGALWLVPSSTLDGRKSDLFDPNSWPAFDVAAVLAEPVAPGKTGTFVWQVRPGAVSSTTAQDRFQLATSDGTLVRCPSPFADIVIRVSPRASEPEAAPIPLDSSAPAQSSPGSGVAGSCACSAGPKRESAPWWLGLGAIGWWLVRRRRPAPRC